LLFRFDSGSTRYSQRVAAMTNEGTFPSDPSLLAPYFVHK
jgi:hypothetical protein